jgi:hypothetical protein
MDETSSSSLVLQFFVPHDGGPGANRTRDPLLRRQVLYPLSYGPKFGFNKWRDTALRSSARPATYIQYASDGFLALPCLSPFLESSKHVIRDETMTYIQYDSAGLLALPCLTPFLGANMLQ